MTNTIYIHQPEKAFSFTRLPNFLFEAPTFQPLSNEAKVLYAFVLRRAELSRKNGWADEKSGMLYYITAGDKAEEKPGLYRSFCNANRVCFNSSQTMAYLKFIINRGIIS